MADEILLIGSGGREHALAWKLSQSQLVKHVYVSPGNAGTANSMKISNISLNVKKHDEIIDWCKSHAIKLVVVGPEDPLANGIADDLHDAGIKCFGPSKMAARIEASKEFAKAFMDRHSIPTAQWESFTDADSAKKHVLSADYNALVIKASGLAAGKGVTVCPTREEAVKAIDAMKNDKALASASETIVVEELLEGEEVSVLCFTDGKNVVIMPPAQDHKRAFDGDMGPNTGGMGAYCQCPQVAKEVLQEIEKRILQKAVDGMRQEGTPYVGVLYAGLMLTKSGPKVLEFNCRFGDPETQVILPLLKSDLYSIMLSCVNGTLGTLKEVAWQDDQYAVGVVVASNGYPGSYAKGKVIEGLDELMKDNLVFHAGTTSQSGKILTSGGRVLCVVSMAPGLLAAAQKAHEGADRVNFEGAFHRKDIAHKAITRFTRKGMTYESCGVSIEAGDQLVQKIKILSRQTVRPGAVGSIGGFGGVFDLKAAGYTNPYLVSGTDGVGTKLKIAEAYNKHDTVGIDLVAMCVNDILTQGAEPLFFLDTFSCGKLEPTLAENVIRGISEGCQQAACTLIGGETAEMPGMYQGGAYDLVGFAVGAVEKTQLLPKLSEIKEGDIVIGLSSSGIHSNGYSLVRKLVDAKELSYKSKAPFDDSETLGDSLLKPTKIYVKCMLPLLKKQYVKAAAHITGGGLTGNIPRVLPSSFAVHLDASQWKIPEVFKWIASEGNIMENEMLQTFNCGLGMVFIISPEHQSSVLSILETSGEKGIVVGTVISRREGEPQVLVKNLNFSVSHSAIVKKKVGVLISGTGTNLQALIDYTQNPNNHSLAEIVLVISNVPDVEGLRRAQRANIPTKVISHKGMKREEFDMKMHDALINAGVEIVCLAGFMRILSEKFVRLWQGHLLNVHPALLPAFKGAHAVEDALKAQVRITGCTVHFVEAEVDAGAIIEQASVLVEPDDTVETLRKKIQHFEHQIFPKALELVARGKIFRNADGKVVWNKKPQISP